MNKQLQIVTFEQAKKLKELDFDWIVKDYYHSDCHNQLFETPDESDYNHFFKDRFSAPTTALALKWLRDEKKLIILPQLSDDDLEYSYYIFSKQNSYPIFRAEYDEKQKSTSAFGALNTFEKAESTGLDYALDYLLKKPAK